MLLWNPVPEISNGASGGITVSNELAIVFGSDQGMCGQFNQQIVSFFVEQEGQNQQRTLVIAVGHRCGSLLDEEGHPPEICLPEAGSAGAIDDCVRDILYRIDQIRDVHDVAAVSLYFAQRETATVIQPCTNRVLPFHVDRYVSDWSQYRQSRSLPMHTARRSELLSSLLREFLFVSLYRACAESLASENAARIQSRQTSITEELLDVIGGFEMLNRQSRRRPSD